MEAKIQSSPCSGTRVPGDDGLTDAPLLGGSALPEDVMVQPLGRPSMELVAAVAVAVPIDAVAVPTQGQTFGVW